MTRSRCRYVRYSARFPSRFACHCHCESCRRAHGAAFVTWIGFPSDQVSIDAGGDQMAVHESSPGTQRKFCRLCGTKLFFESTRWPAETHIAYASLLTPADRIPQGDVFFEEHVTWVTWPLATEA